MGRKYTGVRSASENSIEIDFFYENKRCRERIKLKPTAANLEACSKHRDEILQAIELGEFDYSVTFPNSKNIGKFTINSMTIERYMNLWLIEQKDAVMTSTYNEYKKMIINQIIPALGHIELNELRTSDVKKWVKSVGCSQKRASNLISPIRLALNEAKGDDLISENPLIGWTFKKKSKLKPSPIDTFNQDEMDSIIAALDGQKRNFIQFAFWSGLRTSELIALKWSDVKWDKRKIHIQRAKTQQAKVPEITKTKSSERTLDIQDKALEALLAQKIYTFKKEGFIFHNPRTNQPWEGDQPIRRTLWIPALRKANIRYRKPYQTRHTFASMMITAEENIAWLSKQLGHSSISTTTQRYATFIDNTLPNAGEKASKLFGKSTPESM